jgi:uncharacterized integral membrane protein
MRYLYLAIVILMTLVVVTFMVQNSGSATVSLLSSSATLPLSLLTLGTYFLGMLTGGMLIAFIRSLVRGATKPKPNQ